MWVLVTVVFRAPQGLRGTGVQWMLVEQITDTAKEEELGRKPAAADSDADDCGGDGPW